MITINWYAFWWHVTLGAVGVEVQIPYLILGHRRYTVPSVVCGLIAVRLSAERWDKWSESSYTFNTHDETTWRCEYNEWLRERRPPIKMNRRSTCKALDNRRRVYIYRAKCPFSGEQNSRRTADIDINRLITLRSDANRDGVDAQRRPREDKTVVIKTRD